ncbi:ADP-ribosylglycohydrolase family protein [Streptomyces resistomycificus]|uniref:ADP-ribosylglycohydrolase n=1 Tax=Streptomyces resistomycificus TaxID=67356 RepID=A0A0L8LY32_9ACTN|nr:ADP-ribosylglycohydrolase family protein [Streptomyces resistomycificus]KOG42975.1 ADP-ribosylglycohydrolase [Streptomyces resistomycificus]KUO01395.1 ADP-ribosylglycohydrolase [Streptomyces resistomycificus]
MTWLPEPTLETAAVYRARVRGCLLGGAVGDALGYPIEFASLDRIRASHGERGVTGYVPGAHGVVGRISDDTQMTLFTVEALNQAHARERAKGIGGAWPQLLLQAYERWLETQTKPGPEQAAPPQDGAPAGGLITEAWLYSRRAPGNACLSGVAQMYAPDPWLELDGTPGQVNPDSKGCGTVMRSAPFGLVNPADAAFAMAARGAQITHGHPTGYYAAGALAAIVAHLVQGESLEGSVLRALRELERFRGHEETSTALREALDLAAQGPGTAERVESLGEGWVAEQALAIGVYCALAEPRIEEALLLSVNHSGDSDSTGSICGNLLGARYGDVGLPHAWVERVEGRARIAALADDLAAWGRPLRGSVAR